MKADDDVPLVMLGYCLICRYPVVSDVEYSWDDEGYWHTACDDDAGRGE